LLRPLDQADISFYGFAENQETEINYNYPVVVEKIFVKPGQKVYKGDTLARLYRQERREDLQDEEYKIAVLKAEEALWREKKLNQLKDLEMEHNRKIAIVDAEISEINEKLNYKNNLLNNLQSITIDSNSYSPLNNELDKLETQKVNYIASYNQTILGIKKELAKGIYPYESRISLLNAEKNFDEAQKQQKIVVLAPNDGLIGTISCKEEEHIPSFKTLLTFYEPHSYIVKGYVHEDLILEVNLGDNFRVASLKDEELSYDGKVIGLGSRIVEIPSRLRKIPDFKTYGREVLVEITSDNQFLQKEKVGLFYEEINK
jgi:multidrug resistance efflux pump